MNKKDIYLNVANSKDSPKKSIDYNFKDKDGIVKTKSIFLDFFTDENSIEKAVFIMSNIEKIDGFMSWKNNFKTDIMQERFKIGDQVYKPKGYQFDGTVVSVFKNLKGETRLVAEMDGNGMLHIFNENQLELAAYKTPTDIILQNEWEWKGHKYNSTYSPPIYIYTKKIRKRVCVLEYDSGENILTGYTMTDKTVYTEGGALEQKFSLRAFNQRILNDLELNTNW